MKTCFFIGHRDISEAIYSMLEITVTQHIHNYGIREFFVGHYGNFDRMAARAVQQAKEKHPEIKLTLLMPYLNNIPLPSGFDGSIYPDGLEYIPKRYAILRANRAMVDHCDCIIACVRHSFGGAYQCLEYARRKGKAITNIL